MQKRKKATQALSIPRRNNCVAPQEGVTELTGKGGINSSVCLVRRQVQGGRIFDRGKRFKLIS